MNYEPRFNRTRRLVARPNSPKFDTNAYKCCIWSCNLITDGASSYSIIRSAYWLLYYRAWHVGTPLRALRRSIVRYEWKLIYAIILAFIPPWLFSVCGEPPYNLYSGIYSSVEKLRRASVLSVYNSIIFGFRCLFVYKRFSQISINFPSHPAFSLSLLSFFSLSLSLHLSLFLRFIFRMN